ncbi:MAG: phosphoribosylanthranilate isomerase [Acidimicrobiaceae bacterium]|nr:phosphoribosylanthranilate isomerase [Acidimicrobiaceae bacterium]MCY4176414.1 phosphoribosylanthranilate isomerase [Acidimicrobiaceae bacterium]MCY4280748.1 phosphoribosylanthranilate isomerase [Acidimicrobiaceae bacterium]MCY4295200.1 phosphoribosylanthranilate isomerase [Acidimicrobiaceae bacterium]
MFVKICGVTNEDDALLAVALGADAVGFVFAPSPRQMPPDRAREIANRLPSDVLSVGVFRNELPERVVEITSKARLGAAQLHGHEKPEDVAWVAARVPVTVKAFPAGHDGLERLEDYGAHIVLLDGLQPGSGEVFDWSLAEGAPLGGRRLLLAGGLNAANVAAAIRRVRPWGVDVSSGVESKPGRKDPTALRAFLEAAKSAGETTARERARDADAVRGPASGPGLYDWSLDE